MIHLTERDHRMIIFCKGWSESKKFGTLWKMPAGSLGGMRKSATGAQETLPPKRPVTKRKVLSTAMWDNRDPWEKKKIFKRLN